MDGEGRDVEMEVDEQVPEEEKQTELLRLADAYFSYQLPLELISKDQKAKLAIEIMEIIKAHSKIQSKA
jgi:hypothetical protein